jgi:electron transport complex protein RnfB
MTLDARGLPVIDPARCTGCGICVTECPRGKNGGLLALAPVAGAVAVRCSSRDKVKARREYCTKSCIACKKCERACPSDAIHVIDMLAVVDHTKCTACYACVAVCPQDCIDVTGSRAARAVTVTDGAAGTFEGFVATVSADAGKDEGA